MGAFVVRQIMASHTVSKLLLNAKYFGGLMLSYVAAGRTNQLFALLAWQAWKRSEPLGIYVILDRDVRAGKESRRCACHRHYDIDRPPEA